MRQNKFRSYSGKATNKILQKSILNKLSQSANYMIDPNLMKLLESYSAKEKRLVRIDNIFSVSNEILQR